MKTLRVSFVLCLFAVPALLAQGGSGGQGGPPSLSAPTLFDSQGKQVGKLIENQKPPAFVQYTLAGGDTLLLQATAGGLSTTQPLVLFYGSADCTGTDIYTPVGSGDVNIGLIGPNFLQLTKRQAIIINRAPISFTVSSSLLYVTDPFPTPVFVAGTPTSSVGPGVNQCRSSNLGDFSTVPLLHYHQVEDLSAKFTPPFWAQ